MRGDARPLLDCLEGGNTRYVVPIYQRKYSWGERQCKQLFADLLRLRTGNTDHFFGSIVYKQSCHGERVLIDGQQRITTVCLLLAALVNAHGDGSITFENPKTCRKILNSYLIDEYADSEAEQVKLLPVKDDRTAYNTLILGSSDGHVNESRIDANYRLLLDLARKSGISGDEIFKTIERLTVISISLDEQDDAQLIFESLNSTGLALSEADKIRNYLLMSATATEQERLYNDFWHRSNFKETHDIIGLLKEKAASIEHVMPQTLSEPWKHALGSDFERVHTQYLHTMANLTITGYNSEYGNLPFLDKKCNPKGFCNSAYRLNSFMKRDAVTKWTEAEIVARLKELFKVCLELWPMPCTVSATR